MASPTAVVIFIRSDEEEAKLKPVVVDRSEERRNDGGSDEDDCFILDRDPDEPIRVQNDGPDDELLIVGEKGEVACRDFPHSRHLCANFPFEKTPHEKFCSLCYCYVCDSPAPCMHWGNGVTHTDHCHATEKVGQWKILRNSFKGVDAVTASGEQQRTVVRPVPRPAPLIPGVNPLIAPTPINLEARHASLERTPPGRAATALSQSPFMQSLQSTLGRGATALTQSSFMQSLSPKRKPSPPRYRISYGHKFFRRTRPGADRSFG